jgi:hypothetical protein
METGRFYLAPSETLVRTLRVDEKHNRVIFKQYNTYGNDVMDLDIAQRIWTPMFNIGNVASMVSRKPGTLRKYEKQGLVPIARQFNLNAAGSKRLRLYSWHDILDLVEHIERIRPPGRPSKTNVPSKLNREHLKLRLSNRFDEFEPKEI